MPVKSQLKILEKMKPKKKVKEIVYREVMSNKIVARYDCTAISSTKVKSVINAFNPNKYLRVAGNELFAKIITRYE